MGWGGYGWGIGVGLVKFSARFTTLITIVVEPGN